MGGGLMLRAIGVGIGHRNSSHHSTEVPIASYCIIPQDAGQDWLEASVTMERVE